eukprot:5070864-Pyramimonas_sp.AAC.1
MQPSEHFPAGPHPESPIPLGHTQASHVRASGQEAAAAARRLREGVRQAPPPRLPEIPRRGAKARRAA